MTSALLHRYSALLQLVTQQTRLDSHQNIRDGNGWKLWTVHQATSSTTTATAHLPTLKTHFTQSSLDS